jgi:hypothetical protein
MFPKPVCIGLLDRQRIGRDPFHVTNLGELGYMQEPCMAG